MHIQHKKNWIFSKTGWNLIHRWFELVSKLKTFQETPKHHSIKSVFNFNFYPPFQLFKCLSLFWLFIGWQNTSSDAPFQEWFANEMIYLCFTQIWEIHDFSYFSCKLNENVLLQLSLRCFIQFLWCMLLNKRYFKLVRLLRLNKFVVFHSKCSEIICVSLSVGEQLNSERHEFYEIALIWCSCFSRWYFNETMPHFASWTC